MTTAGQQIALQANSNVNQNVFGSIIFNVKAYGAKGDGSTDDLIAINAAIAAAVANGKGVIYFPPGTYVISGALTPILLSGIYFEGAGVRVSIIRPTSNIANVFVFGDTTHAIVGNGVRNLSIFHNFRTVTAGYTFTFINASKWFVKEVEVTDAFNMFQIGEATVVTNFGQLENVIGNCWGAGVAIDIIRVNGLYMQKVELNNDLNAGAPSNSIAIRLANTNASSDTIVMDNCLFQRFTEGLKCVASAGIVQNIFATNTIFDQHDNYPCNIQPSGTAIIARVDFTNCWFNSILQYGVVLGATGSATVDGVYFLGCRVINSFRDGVLVQSIRVINWKFDNCEISGNSQIGSGSSHGISIVSGCTLFEIVGCTIGNEGQVTNLQGFGIMMAANCDKFIIKDNIMLGNVTSALQDTGSVGTSKNRIIKDNMGYNPLGASTPPAMPASTAAQANTFSVPMEVRVNGGTVTQILKNGAGTGVTSGLFILYPGETLAITYSVAPTWNWFGL